MVQGILNCSKTEMQVRILEIQIMFYIQEIEFMFISILIHFQAKEYFQFLYPVF